MKTLLDFCMMMMPAREWVANGFRTEPWGSCVMWAQSFSLSCRSGGNDPRRAKRPPLSDKESPCGDVEKSHHNITLTAREISIVTSPELTVFLLIYPRPPGGLMIPHQELQFFQNENIRKLRLLLKYRLITAALCCCNKTIASSLSLPSRRY